MDTVKDLKAAKSLISDKARWAQNTMARDAQGVPVPFDSDEACCWCAVGAIDKVSGQINEGSAYVDICAVTGGIGVFNDTHPHADVMAAFDRAIALAEAQSC